MPESFERQLSANSPGVQLNLPIDATGGSVSQGGSQTVAAIAKLNGGRVDRAFTVNQSNFLKLCGKGRISSNALHVATEAIGSALLAGAQQVVISRLVLPASTYAPILINFPVTGIYTITAGTAKTISTVSNNWLTEGSALVSATVPIALRHMLMLNDGIIVKIWADRNFVSGANAAQSYISLQIQTSAGEILETFYGSLNPADVDANGNSVWIQDVINSQSVNTQAVCYGTAITVPTTANIYGTNATTGQPNSVKSAVIAQFVDAAGSYTTTEYATARQQLLNTNVLYDYVIGCGTTALALITELMNIAYQRNSMLLLDIDGKTSDPNAALTFVDQTGIRAHEARHLASIVYNTVVSDSPMGINQRQVFPTSGHRAGVMCARNARINEYGFSEDRKNPPAGLNYPVGFRRMTQERNLTSQELSDLHFYGIASLIYQNYSVGGLFTYSDSRTLNNALGTAKSLLATVDMSIFIDKAIARYCADVLQLNIDDAIGLIDSFVTKLLEYAYYSRWLTIPTDPIMEGQPFKKSVRKSADRPLDTVVVEYHAAYVGTLRVVLVQSTFMK